MTKTVLPIVLLAVCGLTARAQQSTVVGQSQTVRGTVVDRYSQSPLPGASIVVLGTDPLLGTIADGDGRFEILRVPLGRHDFEARFLGYQSVRKTSVLVGSSKEVVLRFELDEQVLTGDDIVVTPDVEKDRPVNELAAVSVRPFTVEETRRYAGGVDDPARLASAFAGVATTGDVADNALIIRGNSPKGVQWRLEGVEIPNPNHFAGLNVAGGGGITLFSSQLLDDSDFLTSAFPAEYGNAIAGIFDVKLRRGNTERREHTFQIGLLGIDIATEGPFRSGRNSSYVVNYRYSTLGLLLPLLPVDGITTYQDLSFKSSFAAGKNSRVDFWGIGGIDGQRQNEVEDVAKRRFAFDRTRLRLRLGTGATGLTFRRVLGANSLLSASLALTGQRTDVQEWEVPENNERKPSSDLQSTTARIVTNVTLNHKFGTGSLSRTGVSFQRLFYDLNVSFAPFLGEPLTQAARGSGSTSLVRAFTHHRFSLAGRLTIDAGLHTQYFA
ncbi:MAG: carboxypeptidase-like regulatory domain-containing protein, partial [Rhodothermales bacterium]|nr:carboxypeptidase-like regulatory domain-containing protein [Rhodothermales bacterium]